jgi:hypothetical protein
MRHEARAKRLRHTHLKNETKLTPNAEVSGAGRNVCKNESD